MDCSDCMGHTQNRIIPNKTSLYCDHNIVKLKVSFVGETTFVIYRPSSKNSRSLNVRLSLMLFVLCLYSKLNVCLLTDKDQIQVGNQ